MEDADAVSVITPTPASCSDDDNDANNFDWTSALQASRGMRDRCRLQTRSDGRGSSEATDAVLVYVDAFRQIKGKIRRKLLEHSRSCCCAATDDKQRQQIILTTRKALRLALSYVSIVPLSNSDASYDAMIDTARQTIQKEAYDEWKEGLFAAILLNGNNKNHTHNNLLVSQRYAAQILCNCVTQCAFTAEALLRQVPTAPSDQEIVSALQQLTTDGVADAEAESSPVNQKQDENGLQRHRRQRGNWVDFMLSCSSNRPALAAVVACLHNSLCSVVQSTGDPETTHANTIASCGLLISTLCRQLVSALALQQDVVPNGRHTDTATVSVDNATATTPGDDATEWIALTLQRLCQSNQFPSMYRSIGSDSTSTTPEHIVLLHTITMSVMDEDASKESCARALGNTDDAIVETHLYMAQLYVTAGQRLQPQHNLASTKKEDASLDSTARQLLLDVFAETLADDTALTTRIRTALGTNQHSSPTDDDDLLPTVLRDTAERMDAWQAENQGRKARDQSMSETDQRAVITLVRVIGNLCHGSPVHQRRLRDPCVPAATTTTTTAASDCRNGLHVLLSSTSMSYACFTLREWAVVAIRFALEDCPENQAIVAELEGQKAVQSAALEDLGIRVDLEASGEVKVTPIEKSDGDRKSKAK